LPSSSCTASRAQLSGVVLALAAVVTFSITPDEGPEGAGAAVGTSWVVYSLVALVLWGVAGIIQKLATSGISSEGSTVWFCAAFTVVGAVMLAWQWSSWDFPAEGWLWTVVVGLLNGLAILAAYGGGGKAAVVTPLIALYPVVTIALAVPLFGERPGVREWVGIVLSLAAAVGLANETPPREPVPS
jgi:transporter family protein